MKGGKRAGREAAWTWHWPYLMPTAPGYPNTCAGRGAGTRLGVGRLVSKTAEVFAATSVTSGYTCGDER
jgi:hypothetical protein